MMSARVPLAMWSDAHDAYARARDMSAEGLMLKRVDAAYGRDFQRRTAAPYWMVVPPFRRRLTR